MGWRKNNLGRREEEILAQRLEIAMKEMTTGNAMILAEHTITTDATKQMGDINAMTMNLLVTLMTYLKE